MLAAAASRRNADGSLRDGLQGPAAGRIVLFPPQ